MYFQDITFSINSVGEDFSQHYLTVTAIDSINVGNVYRKQYNFGADSYVIEGVGGSFGLFIYAQQCDVFRLFFTCFNDGYAFIHPGTAECEYPWPTNVAEHTIAAPHIYPNPFTNLIHIARQDKGSIYLYNTIGQLILTKNAQEAECTVDVEALPPGLYIVCLLNGEGNIVHRQQLIKE